MNPALFLISAFTAAMFLFMTARTVMAIIGALS